tara:strand:+ start:140 stop:469 length:330 start_codon:yes stop_codon:yes gene_type:complete
MKGITMASRKHYFKLADYLGTFKFHLEQFGKATINQIDYDTKQDLVNEFINMKDNITTMLKKDNRLFSFDKFNDEIDRIVLQREEEYKKEKEKEYTFINDYKRNQEPIF